MRILTPQLDKRLGCRVVVVGLALALRLADPGWATASTDPETPPPACAFGISTIVAGTPVEISGPVSPADASVEITADGPDKQIHETAVTTANGMWHALLAFAPAEAGQWTIHLRFNGGDRCQSSIAVTLPGGAVPPSAAPPAAGTDAPEPARGFDAGDLVGVGAGATALLIAASWILVVLTGLASVLGARPLARRRWRTVAIPATFLAVWGGLMTIALIVDLSVSLSHFDTGTPADQLALIDAGIVIIAIGGLVLGALAAHLVRTRTSPKPSHGD